MPIYEVNGRRANVMDDKVDKFLSVYPNAKLIDDTPYYLSRAGTNTIEPKGKEIPAGKGEAQQKPAQVEADARGEKSAPQQNPTQVKIETPRVGLPKSEAIKGTPFESRSFEDVVRQSAESFANVPQNRFNAQVANFRENPDLYRTGNDDYSKQELTPEAYNWLEKNKKERSVSTYSPSTIGALSSSRTYRENTPEQIASIKDYLANTEEGRQFYQNHIAFIDKAKEQLDELSNINQRRRQEIIGEYDKRKSGLKNGKSALGGVLSSNVSPEALENNLGLSEELNRLNLEGQQIENARKAIQAYQDSKDKGVIGQFTGEFSRGFMPMLEDILSFGTTGLADNLRMKSVIDKSNKVGYNNLTDDEKRLLVSSSLSNAIQQYYAPYRTVSQGVASGIEHSMPYMASFGLFSAPARLLTKGATGAIKSGIRAAAQKAIRAGSSSTLAKGIARTMGAGVNLADVTMRSGIMSLVDPRTYSVAIENMNGTAGYDIDDVTGNIIYTGQQGGMDFAEAVGKAIATQTIENFSEHSGYFFSKIGNTIRRGVNESIPGLAKRLSRNGDYFQGINDLMGKVGWNGTVEEFMEEQMSTVLNSLFETGNANWNDLVDPKQQWITFLTVASIGSGSAILNTAGNRLYKYSIKNQFHKANTQFDKAFANLSSERISGDDAAFLKEILLNGTLEQQEEVLTGFLVSDAADSQKQAALNLYARNLQYKSMQGVKEGVIEEAQQETAQLVQENSNPQMNAVMSAVIGGYDNPMQVVGGNIIQNEDGSINRELSDQSVTIVNAEGKRIPVSIKFVESISESIPTQEAIEQAAQIVTEPIIAQQENEEVRPYEAGEVVTTDVYGNGITFTGEIAGTNEDGNYVVVDKASGQQVTVEPRQIIDQDNVEGIEGGSPIEGEMTGKKILEDGRVVSPISANEAEVAFDILDQEGNVIDSDVMPRNEYDALRDFENEPEVELGDDGLPVANGIVSGNEREDAGIASAGYNKMSEDIIPVGRKLDYQEANDLITAMQDSADAAPELELTPENWLAEFGEDGMVDTPIGQVKMGENQYFKLAQKGREGKLGMIKPTLTNPDIIVEEDSKAIKGQETERPSSNIFVKAFVGKDGNRVYYFTSVTIQKDGREVIISNQERRKNRISGLLKEGRLVYVKNAALSSNPVQLVQGNQSAIPDGATLLENKDSEVSGEKQEISANDIEIGVKTQVLETERADVREMGIPVDEEGNPQYHRVPVEVTIEDLTSPVDMDGEIYEPTDEEIDGLVLANKEEASKRFEKLSGKPPKIGANKSKYFAAKKQWTAQVADAKARVDYWNEVEAQIKLLRQKPGDAIVEDIKAMGEPLNGEELAAMLLGIGHLPLLYSDYKRETGFGNSDAKQMFGLFASKEKGGMTIEQAGEQLMLADLEGGTNFFDQDDPNAGRNAILDVLSSTRTRGDLTNYIKNNREAMVERERRAEEEAYEAVREKWYWENLHMTPEEYELWMQGELFSESNVIPDNEIIEFYNIFAEEILKQEAYDSRRERTDDHRIEEGESNESGGIPGSREESPEILQGEEFVPSGGIEGYQGEPGEVATGSDEDLYPADDSLQDSPSTGELTSPSDKQDRVPEITVPSIREGESVLDYASRVNDAYVLHKEEQKVDTNPTDAQKEAGNYRKGHVKVDGFDITIENPKGSERSGVDADGNPWSVTMNNTYGYIRGTEGVDGDHIDVFLGDSGDGVYVVDQVKEDGSFDEHKVMYGFTSVDEAREAYLSNYSAGWKGLGNITSVSKETFKKWVDSSHRKTKPFAEYKLVQERAEGKRDGFVREDDGSDVRFREGKVKPEEQSIIDRAKAEGTYMKAPNGKPSNLDESQWVQVRTQAFKKWFGDWEKAARIEKLHSSKPVEITGEEYKGQYQLNRESAQKYILDNLRGEYTINDTGERVKISKKGAKKVTSHSQGSEAHMQSIVAIPEMIGNSIFIEERPAYKDNAQYDSYRYYVTGLKIGGEDYTARITIGVKNGEFYYDHYLTDIEKGNLIEVAQSFKPTEDAPNPSYANNKDSVLLSILQTNSSKVVDENGEPLVVFHGTPLRRDQITPNRGWQKDGFTYISQEAPFYTFRGGEYSGMIFTSVDAEKARSIAEKRAMSILDDETGKEQWTEEGYVYDLFANIRKPFVSSSDYGSVLALFGDRIPTLSFIGGKGEMVSLDVAKSILKSGNSWLVTETPQFVEKIKELGYDGLIGTDEGIKYIACFTPNQLKDAYDNTGEFSFENDDIRFREVKEKDGSKSLVGLHNISEEKLLKALKLGGFANPSAAVININRQTHEDYGEISLILPSSMIAKSTGRNAGTFSGDAWTPTYPQIERQFTNEGSTRMRDDISKLPGEMQTDVRKAWDSYMDGRDANAFAYQFLYEKGEAPELRRIEPIFSEDIRKKVSDADALDDYDERNAALLDAYIDENFDGDRTKFEDYIEARKRILQKKIDEIPPDKGFRYRKAVERLNDIEERGYEYDSVKEFYDKVLSDIRKSGGVDTYHAIQDALDRINRSEALGREYNKWKGELPDRYGIKEVLFKGYTSSGNRIYLPHTLENVSRIMKDEGLAGATGWGGSFSKFAAGLMKPVGTLSGIRRQKGKLTTNHDDIDAFREKWEKVYFDLGIKLNPGASAFDDTGLYRVEEIATQSNPKSFAKREYGVELSDEDVRQLEEMTEAIRNEYPAMYFETKFERPVYLNEFAAAVIPDNVDKKIMDAMNEAGLQVVSYKAGDETARGEAVKKASEVKGIRFRFIGEKGAENMDKAEESTIRLDNLSVAREMESSGKDAKTIKVATGWERGADGKWRYETEDFDIDIRGNAKQPSMEWMRELDRLSDKIFEGTPLTSDEDQRFEELVERKGEYDKQRDERKKDICFLDDYVIDKGGLFKAYPQLKEIEVVFENNPSSNKTGSYSDSTKTIKINMAGVESVRNILIHEVQHAIQHIEGFEHGGNPSVAERKYINEIRAQRERDAIKVQLLSDRAFKTKEFEEYKRQTSGETSDNRALSDDEYAAFVEELKDAFINTVEYKAFKSAQKTFEEKYKLEPFQALDPKWAAKDMQKYSMDYYNRISGEVEARNVSKRATMTLEERRNSLAMETEDVAREDQIFLENALDDRNYSIRQVKTYHGSGAESGHEQIVSEIEKMSGALHVPVKITRGLDELSEGVARRAIEKGRKVKGWFDTRTGEVVIYLPNITGEEDAKATFLHEIVGHKGLRALLGEKEYDREMVKLYGQLPFKVRKVVAEAAVLHYGGNVAIAMDEYLAGQAEKDETPSWWNKVVSAVRSLLRKMGLNMKLSANDMKYLLWRSRKNLERSNLLSVAEDVAIRYKLGIGEYSREENNNNRYDKAVQAQNDFMSRYNSADILVIKDVGTLAGQMEAIGITDKERLQEIKEIASDGATSAVYLPDYDRILIFAENGSEDYESSLFHENFHRTIAKIELSEETINHLFEAFYPVKSKAFDKILATYQNLGYSELKSKEECIVYALEAGVGRGMGDLFASLDDGKPLSDILNYIGYEEKFDPRGNRQVRGTMSGKGIALRNNEVLDGYAEEGGKGRDDNGRVREEDAGENIRFREDIRFPGNNGGQGRPSLLDAYKKRILELNSRINSLERKIDTYISAEELADEVIKEIKKEIGSDIISEIGKRELNSLLMQVKNAKTKKSLEKIFMNVKKVALAAQSRKLQRMTDKLLALKVQDVNGKNMSIAKNVDDSTRRVFSFIRGKLSDIKKSGLEDDILYLKRENRKAQEEIKRLERTVRDTDERTVKDEALSSIEKHKKTIEDNKGRIQELRKEKSELEKQIADATDIDMEKEMAALNEKLDKAAKGEAIWTQGDNERMAALNIISGQIMNRSHDFEIESIELDIQQRLMNNSSLYRDRMKEPSENKRRIITNAIKENRRQVVALERLINDTRAMQIKQQQMTIEQLEELIANGKNSLLRRTEEEIKRKRHIIVRAIQTVAGKPINIYDKESTEEGAVKKFFSAPLGSFEYMCKRVNTKTLGEDGFLYKYFVEGKDGVMEAYNTYVLGMKEFGERLDEKSKEIFGKEYKKVWAQSDKVVNQSGVHVIDTGLEQRIPGVNPGVSKGYGVRYEIPLSKGQAMYIYQVWKMNDGRTKLELQGFDEDSIAEIRDFIGNDYIKFADWVQEELLQDLRERYNEKYLEMYGTSLAEIKDYVPLRIVKKSVRQESDLSEDKERKKTLEERAGSLINRVVNTKPVDITMSGFEILFEHGKQMEEWNAYARVRRDLDAVLSNTTFRNQLDANTRGSFRNFYDAAAVATKVYHPDQNRFMDEVIGKLSKGIVGGNIAWRLSTALKQILSAPAFWGYSQSPRYMKSLLSNTVKMPVTFKWCMENIPSFRERVTAGTAGNEKLEEKSISKYLDKYIEIGMIPNKLVDAITCSIGAKSIFDYRYGQLIKHGVKEEEARNQALMDADIYYNQTQQSSHPAFLSPMQMSRSIMDRMLTTYQNSNIGYVRKVLAAYYDLTRSLKWKELQKNYVNMYMDEGMSKDEAERKAYRRLLNENKKTAFEAILFAWGMNLLWNIGSQGLLGFFAGDGDDDDNAVSKGISFFLTSPIKGMPGGNLLESIASGYGMNPVLVYDELDKFMKEVKFTIDEYGLISPEIAYTTLEKVSRYGGVDLEVLGNIYLGVEGMVRDGALDDDKMIDFMYMLNSPKSSRAAVAKEFYKDESITSFAEKVARAYKYIPKRDPWEGWVPGAKELNRRRRKDIEKEYDRLHMTEEEKEYAEKKKAVDKLRRKLKELSDDPAALDDYIDKHQKEIDSILGE